MYESGSIIAEEGQPIHGIVIVEGAVPVWKGNLPCDNLRLSTRRRPQSDKIEWLIKVLSTVQDNTMAVSSLPIVSPASKNLTKLVAIFVPVLPEKLTSSARNRWIKTTPKKLKSSRLSLLGRECNRLFSCRSKIIR